MTRAALLLVAAGLAAITGAAKAAATTAPEAAGEPAVRVVRPLPATIIQYLQTTGTVAAMQSVDLVARLSGTLQSIGFDDGAIVKQGTVLFVIEPAPYQSKLRQAQAAEAQQRALTTQAEAEHDRQARLRATEAASQSALDNALASRDSARAALQQAEEATRQAAITTTYTSVQAPFDGVMTAHLVSVGELVGSGSPTKLATIMQLDPVWVNASISEAEVTRARAAVAARGKTVRDLGRVPAEAALAGESGFPHHGTLDYIAPLLDPATGTLAIRGRFDNPGYALLPGYVVSMRVPLGDAQMLLLPEDAIGSDQGTPVVVVIGADGAARQQAVRLGGTTNGMRIVESGVGRDDRVLASAMTDIAPGEHVRAVEVAPAPAAPPASVAAPPVSIAAP